MWQLSETSQELVGQLYELARTRPSSWWGSSRNDDTICGLLKQVLEAGEIGAIPCVAKFLLSPTPNVRRSARATLTVLMSRLPPYESLEIHELMNRWDDWCIDEQWNKLGPKDVVGLACEENESPNWAVLGLVSFHRSGYVRQEAVRQLAKFKDGNEFPFLLIRQNDWVPQVAADAKTAVEQRLNEEYFPHLVRSLRLILHSATFSRHDHSATVRRTIEILLKQEYDDSLRTAVESVDRSVRRAVVKWGLGINGDHKSRIVRYAVISNDPVVRVWACRELLNIQDVKLITDVLGWLRHDSSTAVRREALRVRVALFPYQEKVAWKEALLDRAYSIREMARFYLAKLWPFDIAAFYRQALTYPPDSSAALYGLAETGDLSDEPLFRKNLRHKLPNRRKAAIRGLARVSGEAAVPTLVEHLNDDSPGVIREVRATLASYPQALQGTDLLNVARHADNPFARRTAISLMMEMGKWKSLPWLIRSTGAEDASTAHLAEQKIEECCSFANVFTKPSNDEESAIRDALALAKKHMSEKIVKDVENELVRF
jgi:HEAT repeat protein